MTKALKAKTARKSDAALRKVAADLDRINDRDGARADAAFEKMPATLTALQRRYLRDQAALARKTAKACTEMCARSARFYDAMAMRRKLSPEDRAALRRQLAIVGSLEFAKLGRRP